MRYLLLHLKLYHYEIILYLDLYLISLMKNTIDK